LIGELKRPRWRRTGRLPGIALHRSTAVHRASNPARARSTTPRSRKP